VRTCGSRHDRRLDRAAARGRAPDHEGEVLAFDLAALQRALKPRVGELRARDDEQPGGIAVEAVDDAGALRVAAGRLGRSGRRRGALREQLGERVLAVALGGVDDDSGGLVDDEQVLVLVGDREGLRGLGGSAGGRAPVVASWARRLFHAAARLAA
jgi:hypothetical protein